MTSNHTLNPEYINLIVSSSILCIFDSNFNITYSNDNFNLLISFNSNEPSKNSTISSLNNMEEDEATLEFIKKTLKNNEIWKGELHFIDKDNCTLWLDTTINPALYNSHKKQYIATFLNITEQKKLIANLQQRSHEQGLISILGQISLSRIAVKDFFDQVLSVVCGSLEIEAGMILKFSEDKNTAGLYSGYNIKNTSKIVKIDGLQSFLSSNDRIIYSESLNTGNIFVIPDEFTEKTYNNGIFILIGDKTDPFGVLVLLSKNKRSLNANETDFLTSVCNILSQSETRYEINKSLEHEKELSNQYIDVADVIIIVLDKNEKIIHSNQKSLSTLGHSKNDLTKLNFFDTFIPEKIRSSTRHQFHKLFSDKTESNSTTNLRNIIIPIIDRHGKKRIIKWNCSLLLDKKNEMTSILSAGEDITDIIAYEKKQKRLEEKLHQAQKMEAIGIMTGSIAHDFNNILASILGFSDLIKENIDRNDKTLNEYIDHIQASGIKARDIIDQLQSINLNQSISDESALLPELLKGTLTMLRSIFPPDINISYNIDENTPPVYMNSENLNQLILQLLLSIRKSAKKNSAIKIELSKKTFGNCSCLFCSEKIHGEYACISIHETDTGTDKNKTHSDDDVKLKPDPKDDTTEINTAAKIIHENNGHILIEKKNIDNNKAHYKTSIYSLFRIVSDNKTHEKSIMIVDDENSVATYLGELIKGAGYKVSVFCDSTEALSSFKRQPDAYDLIITDQVMPVITGSELSANILKTRPELPIILCTGHSDVINSNTPLSAGIRAFLKKPVNSKKLLQLTASLLFNS